ncbi:Cystatin domain-containing protein [Hirschfeldia incana]|nr:Cystatin domain-containing protein [Hirschfeldia incana]
MMKCLICVSLILLPLLSIVEGNLGGWQPIKDLSDPNIQAIAKYAVDEHNKQTTSNLVLVKIVEGKKQVVSGMRYSLTIAAKNGGAGTKNYEVVVVEGVGGHSRGLQSFKAL